MMRAIQRCGTCALLGLTFAAGPAVAADDTLSLLELVTLRSVEEAAVSPDGRHVAYLLEVPRQPFVDEDGPAWVELHLAGPAGESRPYVHGRVKVGAPAWMPGGEEISYLAKRDGEEQTSLYAIPLAGGESRRVWSHGAGIAEYAWSPDGRRLAFLAEEPEAPEARALEAEGFSQKVFEEQLRPVKVWWVEPAAAGAEARALELPGSASELSWSPDGGRLAVALAPTPLVDDEYMARRLHVVDPATGAGVAEVEHAGKLDGVAWSPDGGHLAFLGGADLHDPKEGRLFVVPAAGGAPRDLLPDLEGHVAAFAWSDARTLLYLADVGVESLIGRVGLDGRSETVVPPGVAVWSELSLSADGRVAAAVGNTSRYPDELFRFDPAAAEPRRLTDSNPRLAQVRLPDQEVVEYRARDGLKLQGLLVRPLDPEPGRRHPLILVVHGGPESHYSDGWLASYSKPAPVLAARGFALFYPNYRGSTGRGVAFSKLSQGDPAGEEFDDLVDAVDHLVAAGLADPERVGVTGGSYGGYATAWGSTYYSERFAAGVMFAGVSDKISKWGTSDIPQELYLVHERHYPWDDWRLLLERSPLFYVQKARTPLLILHGEADTRVHPGQSRELYRALKSLGQTPVRLVLYPGEPHGNRRAASRLDACLRVVRWMEHYLLGPGGAPPPPELDYPRPEGEGQ